MAFWQLWSAPNSFLAGAAPRTPLGSWQRSPDSLAGLRGPLLLRKGEDKGRDEKGEGKERKGRRVDWKVMTAWEERRALPNANSWIRPCSVSSIQHPVRQFMRLFLHHVDDVLNVYSGNDNAGVEVWQRRTANRRGWFSDECTTVDVRLAVVRAHTASLSLERHRGRRTNHQHHAVRLRRVRQASHRRRQPTAFRVYSYMWKSLFSIRYNVNNNNTKFIKRHNASWERESQFNTTGSSEFQVRGAAVLNNRRNGTRSSGTDDDRVLRALVRNEMCWLRYCGDDVCWVLNVSAANL